MNKKKIIGAILSGGFVILYYGTIFVLFTSIGLKAKDISLPIFIIMSIFILIPLIGIIISLISRIKEIKNGEEEEARKY